MEVAELESKALAANRYRAWRSALRAAVAFSAQFYNGETGFDTAYPPSDRQLLERLEELWSKHHF